MPRRLVQLFAGLVLYGVSSSTLLLAGPGVDPWDVLHHAFARRSGLPTGTWALIAAALDPAGRLAARRHRRCRHRGLRGLHRAASPRLRAPVQPERDRSVATPSPARSSSACLRPVIAMTSDRIGPDTSGPLPWLQFAS